MKYISFDFILFLNGQIPNNLPLAQIIHILMISIDI